jgi:hypothetical protein
VDGGDDIFVTGYASPGLFQVCLYSSNGLAQGRHTLKVTNRPDHEMTDPTQICRCNHQREHGDVEG